MAQESPATPDKSQSSSLGATVESVPKTKALPATPATKGNPAFRALGLPNLRLRLPSRNWLIFLSVVGSWTGALLYDRRQKKRAQHKWCTLVSHIAEESLPVTQLPRRVTIYLAAPPGDGIRSAREHFVEYVKPVLVAAAVDWDVVEGKREGQVRARLAEKIRKYRRKRGDVAHTTPDETAEQTKATALERIRERIGIHEWDGVQGDIVIGRHTWKEYVRGLHEGWLGPMDPPQELSEPSTNLAATDSHNDNGANSLTSSSDHVANSIAALDFDEASPTATPQVEATTVNNPPANAEINKLDEVQKSVKPLVTPPYNTPTSYTQAPIPPTIPTEFPPSTTISFPHILGFLNTPIRMYRFLNRRSLADDVGRQTAAAVLATHRPFHYVSRTQESSSEDIPAGGVPSEAPSGELWEQQRILEHEEKEWPKALSKQASGTEERLWLDDMVLDPRIAERMRKFEVTAADEKRAGRIASGSAGFMAFGKDVEGDKDL